MNVILLALPGLVAATPPQIPDFSLEIRDDYSLPMITKKLGIEFYVRTSYEFNQKYPLESEERAKIEDTIVDEYIQKGIEYCEYELKQWIPLCFQSRYSTLLPIKWLLAKSEELWLPKKERSKANGDNGEGLYVRGRTNRWDSRQSNGKSRSKSRGGRLKFYIFQYENHLKTNCPKTNYKKSTSYVKKDDQSCSSGSFYNGSKAMRAGYYWMTRGSARSKVLARTLEKERYTVKLYLSKATNPLQAKELLQIKEMADQDTPPPTITAMKIPIIKKGEYDIWSMRMRQYICHTDHNLWDIIVNGDLEDEATPSGEQSSPPVPKTAKQLAARRNQERIKSILLLAIPDEYLLKFHNVPDAKSLWAAIKSRFGGNEESKKMQKNVLKHQFENFVTASNETLDKAYDRFQKLISQLEIHGAYVSKEDINQKFLRSLPPSWSQIALIMRNKPDIDEVDIDDLYNNLRVYEDELKRSSGSNSASQNLAFLSSENTNSTNEVSTASGDFGVSTAGGINQVPSTPSAHDIAYSFLAQPTTSPQLENEDFQQMDGDDLEELDLRWQVAMLTVRVKKKGHFARECRSGRSQGRRPYGDRRLQQMDDLSNKSETDSENSLTIFEVRSSDEESTLANNRFTKANEYHVVPPPITGNPLTPRADISFARQSSVKPNVTQAIRSQTDKSGQTSQKQGIGFKKVHKIKACFVCKSTGHLIKDCDFYDQKSPEPRVKNVVNTGKREVKPVWDYGKRVNHQNFSKNWKYPHAKRTFNPSAVLTRAGLVNTDRSNVSTARSISTVRPVYTVRPVSIARPLASKIAQSNSVIRPNHPRLDIVRPKASNTPIKRSYFTQPVYRPKDLKPDVKTFGVKNMTTVGTRAVVSKGKVENVLKKAKWVWRPKMNYQDHVYKYNGSYMLKKFEYGNPEILLQDHAVVDSGCSSHMTGNKAYLET
ncbi:ribonuclease H-like domain-containing protein [Tanacetum coccineum]